MTFVSYAQNFEDVILWRALGTVENGFYIDVGAGLSDVDSVTKAFYELGWSGINVEPDPRAFKNLQADRPRDINVNACAGREEGKIRFFLVPTPGLSTTVTKLADVYRQEGYGLDVIEAPLLPLRLLCQQHVAGDIHFLKIDVEGSERDVLLGMDFHRWRPWIVLVEATAPNSKIETHAQWEDILRAADYDFVYFDGLNRFYIAKERPELTPFFGLPPNVFDGFTLNSSRDACLRAEESEQRAAESRKVIRRLRIDVRAANTTLQVAHADLHATRADLEAAHADLHTTRADLEAAHADLHTTRADLQAAHADLHTTRADLQAARTNLEAVSKRLESAIEMVAARDIDLDAVRLRLDEFRAQLREQEALFGVTTSLLRTRELERLAIQRQTAELAAIKDNELSLAREQIGDFRVLAHSRANELSRLSRKSAQTLAKLHVLQIENDNLRRERNDLLVHVGNRDRQLEAVFSSTSWKLTRPLRNIRSKLSSLRTSVLQRLSPGGRRKDGGDV